MIHLKIFILSQLLLLVCGEDSHFDKLPKECGRTRYDKQKTRIIDGEKAGLGQFPWTVRIGTKEKNSTKFFCGGSLITKFYILSAAHCEDEGNIVRIGENAVLTDKDCDDQGDCAPPHQDIKIKKYTFQNFSTTTFTNDLVLIELEEPVEFNDYVQPICLPHDPIPHSELESKFLYIYGWGIVDIEKSISAKHLMYIIAPILNNTECNIVFARTLEPSQLCIGYDEGGKDSCGGDSGGPASMSMKVDGERRTYLIGVVSFGLTMCGKSAAVYTDVSYFTKWILENIEKS